MRHWLAAGLVPSSWTPRRVWITAFLAFFLLSAAWALASPLTSVPDEPWHMVKAAATVRGQLHGTPITVTTHNGTVANQVPMTGYRLPTAYSFLTNLHECYWDSAHVTAACARHLTAQPGTALAGSTAGNNNPVYYLAVGWPSLLSDGPLGMYGMRLVSAALSAAMLASAMVTAFQWSRKRRYPMAAVLAAATPMVLYLNGSVNPNSLEASSAILLWAAVLSLLTDRQPELVPRLLARAGVATMALLCVRQLGPAWALVIIVCAALAGQPGALRDVIRRPAVWLWTAAVGVVALGSIAWTAKFNVLGTGGGTTHPDLTFTVAAEHTFGQSVVYLRQMVGYFGWLDVQPPFHLADLWFIPVLVLVAAAVAIGKRRDVGALVLLILSIIAIPVLAQGRQAASLGYIWQGRYLLAVAAGLPLLAAAILAKREARAGREARGALGVLGPLAEPGTLGTTRTTHADWLKWGLPRLPLTVTAATLALGFLMFYTTLRRYAVGTHGSLLLWRTGWTPPGTSIGVVVLYLAGAGLAALLVLKSWTPYPGAEAVDGGLATDGDADVMVAAVVAQGSSNGASNGTTRRVNGGNGKPNGASFVAEGANGSASVVNGEITDEDRGAAAIASGTPL